MSEYRSKHPKAFPQACFSMHTIDALPFSMG